MMSTRKKRTVTKMKRCKQCTEAGDCEKEDSNKMQCASKNCDLPLSISCSRHNEMTFPQYTAILKRNKDEGIRVEDLDSLQHELETMLVAVVGRNIKLSNGIASLNMKEEQTCVEKKRGRGRPRKVIQVNDVSLPKSKVQANEIKVQPISRSYNVNKKLRRIRNGKLIPSKEKNVTRTSTSRKLSNVPLKNQRCNNQNNAVIDKAKIHIQNNFWLSIEPYCAEIVPDDLKLLDELISMHENNTEYLKVPSLGKRYSREDKEEYLNLKTVNIKKSLRSNSLDENILKKLEKDKPGPLTRRLLSCLTEENIISRSEERCKKNKCCACDNVQPARTNNTAKASYLVKPETKIWEEPKPVVLAKKNNREDDEILAELRRCQSELKAINKQNVERLKRLKNLATEEISRQKVKKKLQTVDRKVIDIYETITSFKIMKKQPRKEDISLAWKCLEERDHLIKQLHSK